MRNNSNKNNPKTAARIPAARQGAAAKPTSLAERREKAVIRLPEERRKGTKYQVIRGQYLRQANKKETSDSTNAAAIKKAAAHREEKQEKAKRQTMAAKTVKDEKEKSKTSSAKNVSHENNDTSAVNEVKDEYAKSEKAAEYTERLQTNIDLSKAVNIPTAVTWEQVLDHSVQKDSVYSQDKTASERAAIYKEKANFYLDKMKKNAETGQKEINPNRDKDVGELYKKAYKLAHKEDLLGKKTDTLFDKAQSAVQLKSEVDNALNKDSTGEAVAAAAAIPFTHAATRVVRKLADKNKAVNAGKTGFELAAKVTAEVTAADGVGEATANAVAAVPKFVVEKKVEKTVRQVMQDMHDRKIEAQKEKLRQQQEKLEKRAQQMKKENMQRNMKADLYKSEHGMGSKGNVLQRIKSAVKAAINNMKRIIESIKSLKLLLFAGGSALPIIFIFIIIVVLVVLVIFPFFYTSKDGKEENIEDSTFGETVLHYYEVMDGVVDEFNASIDAFLGDTSEYNNTGIENPEKKSQYDSDYADYQAQVAALESTYYDDTGEAFNNYVNTYGWDFNPQAPEKDYWYTYEELSSLGMERGPIFEGFVWDDESDAQRVPKGELYDEMLCTISTYNTKLMSRPETVGGSNEESEDGESGVGSGEIIFMNDENVAAVYGGSDFWEFDHWTEGVDCPSGGACCSKTVVKTVTTTDENGVEHSHQEITEEAYCPTHYIIKWGVWLDFDLDRIWDSYNFDEEDEETYEEVKEEFDKEKEKAGIT